MPGGFVLPARRAALLAAALLLMECGRRADHRPTGRPPVPVVLGETQHRDVPETLSAVGAVQPLVTVAVKPLVTGEIVRVLFREGDEVEQGRQLFQIDPRPYQAALAQARANRSRAREQASNARADARRYAELVKKEYVTEQQYQTALANAAALRSDVAGAEAAVRRAELDLQNCRVESPIEGRTGAVLVQIGNVVQANQANPLVVITQMRPISVSFTVPEGNVAALVQGIGRMKVAAGMPGAPSHEGTLSFVNNSSDPSAGTILAKATFTNEDESLWPGQFVNVTAVVGVKHDAVVAPASAVVTGQSGPFVYVVKGDFTVEQRSVKVARADAEQAVIAEGLAPGERVVVDGQLGLEPGVRVSSKPPVQQAEHAPPEQADSADDARRQPPRARKPPSQSRDERAPASEAERTRRAGEATDP